MPEADVPTVVYIGALLFGFVVGWISYRTLRRRTDAIALSDIAAVIAAVAGAAVTGIFDDEKQFAWYAIGLFAGFFAYLAVSLALDKTGETVKWMGGEDIGTTGGHLRGGPIDNPRG